MTLARRMTAFSAALVLTTALVSLPLACGEGEGTSGKRIALEARVVASQGSADFTNAVGWRIRLTRALVATGPLYYYDGETIFAERGSAPASPGSRLPSLGDFIGLRTAFAHPGHYIPGNAKGEMLTSSSADLLAGATLGTGNGVSGDVRSATFSYDAPAKGPFAGELGTKAIVLEGTAEKSADSRIFRAEISLDETYGAGGRPQVEGCPFTPIEMQADGVVTIEVRLPLWFDQVAFDDEPKSLDGKPVLMPAGLARNQLVRGTKAGLAYTFSYAAR